MRMRTAQELACYPNFLLFLLTMPVSIVAKTFPFALALAANHFTVPFNYIPFAIASDTDHFNPLQNSDYGAIERVPSLDGELCNSFTWLAMKILINGDGS